MTDIRTAALTIPTATVPPTTTIRRGDDARLLKKIHAIRPVLVERARIAAAAVATPALTS